MDRLSGNPVRRLATRSLPIVVLCAGLSTPAGASQAPTVTNGGFMQTRGPDGKPVVLPLRRTEVEAEVAGVVASVEVMQEFQNPYGQPIAASYLFPLPVGAAVNRFLIDGMARLEILDRIYFAFGNATVSPVSRPILDAIAATLRGNPQIELLEI
jgi:outer membrane protein OmpA-like peptidoglycan-associated protein